VREGARRQGIGSVLVRAAEWWAQVKGVTQFRLTAYDGALMNPSGSDRFRIKVTNSVGVVVFDNRLGKSDDLDLADPQTISAGNIVIHKA
jgi:GNAT superfamily N-acetyltransferase